MALQTDKIKWIYRVAQLPQLAYVFKAPAHQHYRAFLNLSSQIETNNTTRAKPEDPPGESLPKGGLDNAEQIGRNSNQISISKDPLPEPQISAP